MFDVMLKKMVEADRVAEKEAVRTTANICVEGLARVLRREAYERTTPCLPYTTTRIDKWVPWEETTLVSREGWRRSAANLLEAARTGSDQ